MTSLRLLCLSLLLLPCLSAVSALTLVKDGQPAATIVLSARPTRAAQFAAAELQWHVREMTGGELPICRENESVQGAKVLVGDSQMTHQLGLWNNGLANQEYVVKFLPAMLVLMGRDKPDYDEVQYAQWPTPEQLATWPDMWDEIGTVYAVHDLLEKYCGVRWYNHGELGTIIPKTKTLAVGGEDLRRTPAFRYRFASYLPSENYDRFVELQPRSEDEWKALDDAYYPNLRAAKPDWWQWVHAKRGYVNLFRMRLKDGGEKCVANHSLYGYYDRFWEANKDNPAVFEAKHADWFAQGYEGRPPQMCYTSRGLIEQVASDAREYFDTGKSYPGAQNSSGQFFCVEPMDNSAFCKCDACQELIKRAADSRGGKGFSAGRDSDYFFNFVNEVAKEVRKTHPDKWIVTLAYMSHAWPPKSFKLEPNVAVQFCFASNRMPYARQEYDNELKALHEWAKQSKERPMYLWLYYTFPVEVAANNKFNCFPGFFAHAIDKQMKLFYKLGYRGMFHCGYGQEVEAYVTYKLMDDPTLKVDDLLNQYFTDLYGPAGEPLLAMYLDIEKRYCDPKLYPANPGHQTVDLAWGKLGTPEVMARYADLMARAERLAQTEEQKQRVALWDLSVWQYMQAGAEQYQAREAAAIPALKAARVADANGDVRAVNWDQATPVVGGFYQRGTGLAAKRQLACKLAHDSKYLYLELSDPCETAKLEVAATIFPFDTWEIFTAAQRAKPYRQFGIGPSGSSVALDHGAESNVEIPEHGIVVASDTSQARMWRTRVAMPYQTLVAGGLSEGKKLYLNVLRVTNPTLAGGGGLEVDSLVSHCSVHQVDRLAEVTLE